MELHSLETQVEADLAWREAELAVFREMLASKNYGEVRSRALFRAGWALLYAHYEGFIKFCLDLYLEYICKRHVHCRSLPHRLFIYLIDEEIQRAKSLPPEEIVNFFLNEFQCLRDKAPQAVTVNTQSNLWPDLLEKILVRLDLEAPDIVRERRRLQTLVARRNDIAHGKKVFIDDFDYYPSTR